MSLAVEELARLEPDRVISGMAQGWDTAVAIASAALGIPFLATVPFKGQEERWPEEDQRTYRLLLEAADEVVTLADSYREGVYRVRDEWMVDRGHFVLALFDESSPVRSGTGMTVRYAVKKRVPIINLWKDWISRPRVR